MEEERSLPLAFDLRQNYPNPFNGETQVEFTLAAEADVSLQVYDMLGRPVTSLASGVSTAGRHLLTWSASDENGTPLPSGVYLIRLSIDGQSRTKKALLLR